VAQPAPAPRFSRTPSGRPAPPRPLGDDLHAVLADWGIAAGRIEALVASGALADQA
jgi:alpha-methylacyl-CoA racemase